MASVLHTEVGGQTKRLVGVHNPTGTWPSFLLPIFKAVPEGNSDFSQVLSADASLISDFETVERELDLAEAREITVSVGDLAVHAFQRAPLESLIGTKSEVAKNLVTFIDDPKLIDLPILRLEVVDFCDAETARAEASSRAYLYLRELSKYSADFWRDQTYLSAQARRLFRSRLERAASIPSNSLQELIDGVTFSYVNGIATVEIAQELHQALFQRRDIDPHAWLAGGMTKYLAAFNLASAQFRLVVDKYRPSKVWGAAETAPLLSERPDVTNILIPIGKSVISASRASTNENSSRSVYLDEEIVDLSCIDRCVEKINEFMIIRETRPQQLPSLTLVIDTHDTNAELWSAFLDKMRVNALIQIVAFYKTRNGEPKFQLSSLERSYVRGATVIAENEFPLGEAFDKTSRGTLLNSYLAFVDGLDSEERKEGLKGLTLYGLGWSRGGISNYSAALFRSVASTTNPVFPVSRITRAVCLLSSVGSPSDTLSSDAQSDLNGVLESQLTEPIKLDVAWKKRRFIPGGSVPTSFEFLGGVGEDLRPTVDGLAEGAKSLLLLGGFSIAVTSGRGNIFNAVRGAESIQVGTQLDRGPLTQDDLPYVWVALSDQRRAAYLETKTELTDAWPLLLGELAHLGGKMGPQWAAKILAHLAYPKKKLPVVLRQLVEAALMAEVRAKPQLGLARRLVLNDAVLKSLAVGIENVARLPGKRAKLDIEVVPSFIDQTVEASNKTRLVVTLGPDEFSIEQDST